MTQYSDITPASDGPSINYFNYFTEVEDAFIRRRGKHLMLCALDWSLIEVWKERGIPLHIVLRGIESWFDFYETKRRRRSVNMLMYCQEEVEAQFAEWREARVGSDSSTPTSENGSTRTADSLPFAREAIAAHLRRGRESLLKISTDRSQTSNDDFTDTLTRAAALLSDLENDFAASTAPDAQKLEQSLSGLERMISDGLRAAVSSEQMTTAEKEVKDQLKPYRKHMEPPAYQQTFQNLLLKRLRELFGIPRLSLFYL